MGNQQKIVGATFYWRALYIHTRTLRQCLALHQRSAL